MNDSATSSPTPLAGMNPAYGIAKPVYFVSLGIIIVSVLFALLVPSAFAAVVGAINSAVANSIGWYYVLVVAAFVAFSLVVACTRLGSIRLGRDEEEPEFGLISWFAMLFAAGMGIGLVFWGAAEPLSFFTGDGTIPPNAAGLNEEGRAQRAMGQTFLHWGVHAWAIYVVVGLAIAYAVHRKGRPVSIRWALEPILGRYTNTWIGDVIDIIAVVGTLFGVATSLGFGVNQITAGLNHLGLLPDNATLKVILVLIITALATISAVSGVDKGIKILSNANLVLAGILLLAVLILGPTLFILREYVAALGYYIQNFISLAFQTLPFYGETGSEWLTGWTVNYWGWWMSWAPFVGVFIARISRGRTVREFVLGVLAVPTLVGTFWFTVMGGTAIGQMVLNGLDLRQEDGSIDSNTALFDMFANLPASALLSGIAVILVTIFFITSADSGAFVVAMIVTKGDPSPSKLTRLVWAIMSGVIAAGLIGAGAISGADESGMSGLQAMALVSAAPFSIVMIGMMVSVMRSLRREVALLEHLEFRARQRETIDRAHERLEPAMAEQVREEVSSQMATSGAPASDDGADNRSVLDRRLGTRGRRGGSHRG